MNKEKKFSRTQWVRDLIASGKTKEEVLKIMEAGNPEKEIKPIVKPYNKMIYDRIIKKPAKK